MLWRPLLNHKKILDEHKPARAIVALKKFHFGTKIEIQAIACVKKIK